MTTSDHMTALNTDSSVDLEERIRTRRAEIGIIGLGYVGLPEAMQFARAGFQVTGFDIDTERVGRVNHGISYIEDVDSLEMAPFVKEGRLRASTDFRGLADMDVIHICVPTPLRKTRDPDISFIVSAVEEIRRTLRKGQMVILESTTYPGTTEEVVAPTLASTGLKVGTDVHLCFSPERVNPGDKQFPLYTIPKVVGGFTPRCAEIATALYSQIVNKVVAVSSTKTAEAVKLLENTFRAVNIGLVNELALMCSKLDIDVWEIIGAASTKPFGFMPFYPGPGLGGHCIPVDPLYLSWTARLNGFEARFIELAAQINGAMPHYVVTRITEALNERAKSLRGSKVLVLGVAYKRDVGDIRESPSLEIITLLLGKKAQVAYHDPHVPWFLLNGKRLESVPLDAATLADQDCVVIATDHSSLDYAWIAECAPCVVDTRNAMRNANGHRHKVVTL
ncbi:MAG TPA: nucleotide sugar dehydrogenase [Methylomirabilota bacterium]|jgi:UDP-N-acetyl-D-glucosamine dehydrogenase|nr:nucleotide sugar dehydrogenase [Methylomirabilota bacterium]